MAATRLYSIRDTNALGTVGTWTYTLASNITSLVHTDADDTSVVVIPIPKIPRLNEVADPAISIIATTYSVATASLDAAPTAVLNKLTKDATTKAWSRAAVTQTLTFAGTNTVGTAAGTYDAIVTITTPAQLADNEAYELELTFNAAATSVLKLFGVAITHTGA